MLYLGVPPGGPGKETVMPENCEMSVREGILTITVKLNTDLGLSKSQKSRVIATTRGNARVPGAEDVMIGLNVYKKIEG